AAVRRSGDVRRRPLDDAPRMDSDTVPAVIRSQAQRQAPTLPTGTVTFLLTDIERSTDQGRAAPTATAASVARHYEILDRAITAHGGVQPVEQGEGDGVVAAFERASDGVAAAIDAQLAFASDVGAAELSVRMAVNSGEAELRGPG